MSKWVEIRDEVVEALHLDDVTEEAKEKVTQSLVDEIVPIVETAVDTFCVTIKAQSKTEAGWCRIRDGIVLPLVLQGAVSIVKMVLTKTLEKTAK